MKGRHIFVGDIGHDVCDYICQESESLLNISNATLGEKEDNTVTKTIRSGKTGFITSVDYNHRDLWGYTSNILWSYINEANRQ